jgi:ferric-dicitrate binding protein FerR (iron transport regulator)
MHPYRPYGPYREWLTAERDKRCTSRIAANLPTLPEFGTNRHRNLQRVQWLSFGRRRTDVQPLRENDLPDEGVRRQGQRVLAWMVLCAMLLVALWMFGY